MGIWDLYPIDDGWLMISSGIILPNIWGTLAIFQINCYYLLWVSIAMVVRQNGWFMMEKPIYKWMMI